MKLSGQKPSRDETPEPTSRVSGLPVIGRLFGLLGIGSNGRADAHRMAHQARRSGYKPRTALTSGDAGLIASKASEPPAASIESQPRKATARRPRLSLSGMSFGRMLTGLIERLSPKEPRRREMAVLLGLPLAACLTSVASLAIGPAGASGREFSNVGVEPTDEPTPTATIDVPTEGPTESLSPTPSETPSPTPAPTKKPRRTPTPYRGKIYTFVAIGDSITALPTRYNWPRWLDVDDVRSRCVNNAGTPGNLTSQMLARFSRDVLSYKPDFVLIMGGTNDISPNYYVPQAAIIANLRDMVRMAKSHKSASGKPIKPYLMLVTPQQYAGSVARVKSLNNAIKHLANNEGIYWIDSFSPLATNIGTIRPAYTSDGLHLTLAGASAVAAAAWHRVRRQGF